MKTVCKKLLCLMLVAMMLVSAVPFAFAAGTNISVYVYTGDVNDEESMEYVTSLTAPLASTVEEVKALRGDAIAVYDMDLNQLYSGTIQVDEVLMIVSGNNNQDPVDPEPVVPEVEKFTVRVTLLKSDDTGSAGSGSKVVEKGTYVDFEDLAAEFCTLSKYSVQSVLKSGTFLYTDGMEINSNVDLVIYVKPESSATTNPGIPNIPNIPNIPGAPSIGDGDESKPTQTAGKCQLTVKYNLGYTDKTMTVEKYATYDEYVGIPARPGYSFRGWFSEYYDDFIDISKNIIKGDDVIEAVWSAPLKYSLTFDVNRKGVEQINTLKQVTYGQAIGKLPRPETDDYVFLGWKLNGKMINENTVYELQGDAVAYAVWAPESDIPGIPSLGGLINGVKNSKVYLEIYTNGDVKDLVRRVDITDYADDNKITQSEAEKVAKKYVTAKSGYSLSFYGLFDEQGWWDYCHDRETDGKEYIRVNREGDEYIYIMVKNVKKAVADSSNPKTGDNIMIAVSAMALSAAALVSIVELKKRKMI